MSRVRIEGDQLVITMQGSRKFFAMKSEVSIYLGNIAGVTSGLEWCEAPKLFEKRIGTDFYGFYFGGTFKQDGNRVFYDLKKREDAVVISIKDESFDTVIIGVDDAKATIELIDGVLKKRNGA